MKESWGRRLRDAKRDYEKERDTKLTYREIGERVAAILKRPAPYTPTAVRAWFEGPEPDVFDLARALARVLDTDPRALVFPEEAQKAPAKPYGGKLSDAQAASGTGVLAEQAGQPRPAKQSGHK